MLPSTQDTRYKILPTNRLFWSPSGLQVVYDCDFIQDFKGLFISAVAYCIFNFRIHTLTNLGIRKFCATFMVFACFVSLTCTPTHCHAEREPPFLLPPRQELLKLRSAIIETSRGSLYFELLPEEAPWHVANFKYLADKKFYQGLKFHVHEPGYLLQGGDPKGSGFGGPGYSLPPEFSTRNHRFGTLGMARKPDAYDSKKRLVNPERRSSGSQFHILLAEAPHMDGRYTIFGKLVGGSDVLTRLRANDTIKNITVYVRQGGR